MSGKCPNCGMPDSYRHTGRMVGPIDAEIARLKAELADAREVWATREKMLTGLLDRRDARANEACALLDTARADLAKTESDHEKTEEMAALQQLEIAKLKADLASVESVLLRALPPTGRAGDDTNGVPAAKLAETVVRDLAAANKVAKALDAWWVEMRTWGDPKTWPVWYVPHVVLKAIKRGEGPGK